MFIVEFYQDMLPLREIATSNAEFCMLLFYNITSKKNLIATDAEIKDHTPRAKYSSYIRDKQCRPINSLAHKICRYRSPEEFEKFLNDNAHYPHIKQELLSNFKNRYKDRKITEKNLFKQIAAIFDKLIEDAAKEYENSSGKHNKDKSEQSAITQTNSEPNEVSTVEETTVNNMANINENTQIVDSDIAKSKSAVINDNSIEQEPQEHIEVETNTSVERQVTVTNRTNNITLSKDNSRNNIIINTSSKSSDELVKLKELIKELNSLFMDLDEKGRSIYMSSGLCSEEEQKEKEQEFKTIKSDFINEHKKLRHYYLSFSELKVFFEEMISLSRTLTFWYRFKNDDQNHTRIVCDHQIEKYSKCINEVWDALTK